MAERLDLIDRLASEHPSIPPEAIVKEDLLRSGVSFSEDALTVSSGYKPKAYFIFSFDLVPIEEMRRGENLRAPEEMALIGGNRNFRRTIVSVRLNPKSPYRIEISEAGRLSLILEGTQLCEVELQRTPSFYRRKLKNGKPLSDMAPTIEWGYLLYLTVFRQCQYFGEKEECQFCDINENYRQQRRSGRSYTGVKSVEGILEALEIVASEDSMSRAYTVTGGSVTKGIQGKSEVDFYLQYPEAIERRFPGRWISKLVVQAAGRQDVARFRDVGVQIYHPNYEVWDKNLFSVLCPGKDREIGREEWIHRILEAADVMGPRQVIPNFVAGIEMARPHGFTRVEDAVNSTAEGLEFFMSQGVSPRFTTWCPEPLTVLGRHNRSGAPLEYHISLLERWRDTHRKYGLQAPPGYGEAGIGAAVFSVSSFMDVLPRESASLVDG